MGIRIGIGIKLSGASIEPPPSPPIYPVVLDDGNTIAWFDAQENITKDGSNLVSAWGDKSGLAHHLLQAAGTNQPLWSANGILFDGVDNMMKCVAFPWNQPEFIYMVIKQVTWTNTRRIFDGNAVNSGVLAQSAVTPEIKSYAGTWTAANNNLVVDTWSIVRILFNGLTSSTQVNETAKVEGNGGIGNMGGFTLGASGIGSLFGNIEVKEIIGRISVVGEAEIYAYLAAKYGI